LGDWCKYTAKFKSTRARVADRTDAEEHQQVFCQLTPNMQRELMKEQAKRRRNKPWVSVHVPPSVQLQEVIDGVAEILEG